MILKGWLLPRLACLPFYICLPILFFARLLRHDRTKWREQAISSKLCIEAGIRGWDSLEFKELYKSACEFLKINQVIRVQVYSSEPYLLQVKRAIKNHEPTHYFYDSRTGNQKWFLGLWEAFRISLILHSKGIIPIVLLTDLSVRSWRAQSAVVTAVTGIVITFMSPRMIHPIFPHRRLIGPTIMPLSADTMSLLNLTVKNDPAAEKKAFFIGSLYEPRTSKLKEIKNGLFLRGQSLEILGRVLGAQRVSDFEYWSVMKNAGIVITTADQIDSSGSDWTWISHLVYRYLEVLASGTLLVAPEVAGIHRFFISGEHFISFKTTAEAIDVIDYYLTHDEERQKIAAKGKARAEALITARNFWTSIDVSLGKSSMT